MTRRYVLAIAILGLALAGCGSDSTTQDTTSDATTTTESDVPVLDGSYNLECDYLLGNGLNDYRFVGGGTVTNDGNIGIEVWTTFKWEQLGGEPVEEVVKDRLEVGQRKRVSVSVDATGEQVDAHQAADSKCSARTSIEGTFGEAE